MYNDKYMKLAIKEAYKSIKKMEVPVGAIIVKNEKIISKAHNLIETKKNVMNHAEILAIKKATKKLSNWRLSDCDLYVTLEPCCMCKEIIELSRIRNVYYSTMKSNKKNIVKTNYIKIDNNEKSTTNIIKDFFRKIR